MLRRIGRFAHPTIALAAFVLLSALCARAQQPTTNDQEKQFGSVSGTVLAADTGQPLRKVRLTLRDPEENRNHLWIAITDASGQFSIDHIPPGRYTFTAGRTGYLQQEFSQTDPDKPGAIFAIAPGQKITDVIFHLQRMAVIAGRVTDEDGDPVQAATVFILERRASRRSEEPSFVSQSQTDDLGEYRVSDLEPGRYMVRVAPPEQRENSMATAANAVVEGPAAGAGKHAITYYPSTSDIGRAAVVELKAGDEATGIDVSLAVEVPHPTFKIRGRVSVALPNGEDMQVVVMVLPRQEPGRSLLGWDEGRQAVADPHTGEFEIRNVPPGSYRVVAASFSSEFRRTASQDATVVASDIEGINLALTSGAEVAGKVRFEGAAASQAKNLRVRLDPGDDDGFTMGTNAAVQTDGKFVVKGVNDGSYSVHVYSGCGECYTKAVTADGADVLEKGVQISGGAGPSALEILYSSNTGIATGVVMGKDDMPIAAANVVVVSDKDAKLGGESSRSGSTDQNGRFEIRGLPPGKYTTFAFEKETDDWDDDADLLPRIRKLGESVDISANQTTTVQLKLIPASAMEEQK